MEKSFTLLEFIFAIIIIIAFIGVLLTFIHKAAINAKEVTLQVELKNLRLSLDLYKAINEHYPEDLRLLIQAKYKMKSSEEFLFGEKFLETVGKDEQGYPLDPFGNRFFYNSRRGVINSQTKGYEQW